MKGARARFPGPDTMNDPASRSAKRPDQRFRKKERLRLRAEFARVYARRCRHGNDRLLVYVAENGLDWSRLGLSVGKRVGNAVTRNRVRRTLREAYRTGKDSLPRGIDIICVAKPQAADATSQLARSLRTLIVKASGKLGPCRQADDARADRR